MKGGIIEFVEIKDFIPHEPDLHGIYNQFIILPYDEFIARQSPVEYPHRHEFYYLLYIDSGRCVHYVDLHTCELTAGSLLFISPGQIHARKLDKSLSGYIILFTPLFYSFQPDENNLVNLPFYHSVHEISCFKLEAEERPEIIKLLETLYQEQQSNNPNKAMILRAYLNIILLKIANRYHEHNQYQTTDSNYQYLRKFEHLLEKKFHEIKLVKTYADLLTITPNHLNTICIKLRGKSASAIIAGRVLLEAQRLLQYSNLNISEIARHLNFKDVSYFTRFFKKAAGTTPLNYKKEIIHPVTIEKRVRKTKPTKATK